MTTKYEDDAAKESEHVGEVPAAPAEAELKKPFEWAMAKDHLRLNPDGTVHYRTHTPWQYTACCVVKKWPDPQVDPTFVISEAEYDAAVASLP